MLEIDARQQAMLKEMGIRLPWPQATHPSVQQSAEQTADQAISTKNTVVASHAHGSRTGNAGINTAQPPQAAVEHIQAMKERVSELRNMRADSNSNNSPQHLSRQHAKTTKPPAKASNPQSQKEPSQEVRVLDPQALEALKVRAQHIAQASWQELEEAAKQCDACALCKSRKQAVFAAGDPSAKWMIVGEAPGEQEDKQGIPFVGPAGRLLDRMLEPLNISRAPQEGQQPLYICNVLKCRPPCNRNPDVEEMALCEPFLKRQIELVQPKVILIMGRFAVQTLLNTKEAIGRLRGQVHSYSGIPAIVTYHPAYLLRNPVDKRKSWADLCLAADVFKNSMVP